MSLLRRRRQAHCRSTFELVSLFSEERQSVSVRFLLTFLIVLFSCAVVVVAERVAFAQQPKAAPAAEKGGPSKADKQEATRLKKEADVLMDQDRHADALSLYANAYRLTNDPALLYNQGRALEAMGEYPEALDKLEQFEKDAPPTLRAKVPGLQTLIQDLRGRISTLVVTTNAPGARLLVRDKLIGPIEKERKLRTRFGTATVEVLAEGYITFKKDIELKANEVVKVDANLILKKTDALVIVRSRPAADIALDGKAMGRSPLEFKVGAGAHELVATAEGHQKETVPMTLALGDKREVDIELHKPPSILSRWWFWTVIGVAVAGGAAAVIAINIERDPTPGTFGGGTGVLTGP
jgi:hypothetical protein